MKDYLIGALSAVTGIVVTLALAMIYDRIVLRLRRPRSIDWEELGRTYRRALGALNQRGKHDRPTPARIPAPPPIETEVSDRHGEVYQVQRDPDGSPVIVRWGHHEVGWRGDRIPWAVAYAELGPITPIDQNPDDARLYGPWGARWGNPGVSCPYPGCALGMGHTGRHLDDDGAELGPELVPFAELGPAYTDLAPLADMAEPCNCGHPEAHTPSCPRYPGRIAP